jgi:hypothetical protein
MKIMTKKEFKAKWESDEDGGGITFDDIAECAKAWGISARPRTRNMEAVVSEVLLAAGVQ